MSQEGSVSYPATYSVSYDPGIFFIPGAGAKIAQPNASSILSLTGALSQATSLLDQAKSTVSTLSGGSLKFDANAVGDFALNAAVSKAQEALSSGVPEQVTEATSLLSKFNPQTLTSITTFNSLATLIDSPQELISEVSKLSPKSLGSLNPLAKAGANALIGSVAGQATESLLGGADSGAVGKLVAKTTEKLVGSLGPQASKLLGGSLPDAETWGNVFGSAFDPALTPFLNLSYGQVSPALEQALELNINGIPYSKTSLPGIGNYVALASYA